MNKLEIEDLKKYRDESKRELLFSDIPEKFQRELISHKAQFKGFMTEEDVDSNAVLALSDTYDEIEERMFEFALKRIDFRRTFSKHMKRECRQLKSDNEPLSKSLAKGFRNDNMRRCWDGYSANYSSTDEETLVDNSFVESFGKAADYSGQLSRITQDEEGSDVNLDLKDRYIDHMSFREISKEARNSGKSAVAISKRLHRYVIKLQERVKLTEGL
jgi:hypothetical protein